MNVDEASKEEFALWREHVRSHSSAEIERVLRGAGSADGLVQYALGREGTFAWSAFASWFVRGHPAADMIACCVALHMVGIKLLDDLADEDSPFPPQDLLCGARLGEWAAICAASLAGGQAAAVAMFADMAPVWCAFSGEPLGEKPDTLGSWLALASAKAADLLQAYVSFAVRLAGERSPSEAVTTLARNLGLMLMVRDDLRDFHEKAERSGNLWHILQQDCRCLAAALGPVHQMALQANAAAGVELEWLVNEIAADIELRAALSTST
ncbi:hypothetical protein [Novosphingobium sp. BL-52-GroH]|uniref:hypothetical protein n=1 Tax=Novosphingobium sp. BL-52-GroH TaxID=3349877 RepID=UPI00384BD1BB